MGAFFQESAVVQDDDAVGRAGGLPAPRSAVPRPARPAGAAEEFAALLPDRKRVLGPTHPHTFATRFSLANLTGEAGDPGRAVMLLSALLADQTAALGSNHPDTLGARRAFARWRG
ncbi:hypothetical protein C7M71_002385 [Peterkaempfera bronchialis]|uniref:Tetratricopeptide repeat protein n=1 Tax=Peterkaempfera bronchialis TaxID=2126346 RepID=A0A345SRY3_9ACTN|nr:hypothetical protein C7M71_002385 [Peterkaempfera bronchialis]